MENNRQKIETLKGFLDWLSPEKFMRDNPCKCWGGLLAKITGYMGRDYFACALLSSGIRERRAESFIHLLSKGFKEEEIMCFEYLLKFWEGKNSYEHIPYYNEPYAIYDNGIQYLKEWIVHLERLEAKKEERIVYRVKEVKVSKSILENEPSLN